MLLFWIEFKFASVTTCSADGTSDSECLSQKVRIFVHTNTKDIEASTKRRALVYNRSIVSYLCLCECINRRKYAYSKKINDHGPAEFVYSFFCYM